MDEPTDDARGLSNKPTAPLGTTSRACVGTAARVAELPFHWQMGLAPWRAQRLAATLVRRRAVGDDRAGSDDVAAGRRPGPNWTRSVPRDLRRRRRRPRGR